MQNEARELIATCRNDPGGTSYGPLLDALWRRANSAGPGAGIDAIALELALALETVAAHGPASILALALGGLVEAGARPEPVAPHLAGRAKATLADAARFVEAVAPHAIGDESDDDAEDVGDLRVRSEDLDRVAGSDPDGWEAVQSADRACLPVIAALTRSERARGDARSDAELVAHARRSARVGAHWLDLLLRGIGHEEWLVLHPATEQAFEVSVHEIVDDWCLEPLLAAALVGAAGGLPGEPEPDEIVRCFRGEGPQSSGLHCRGRWNLLSWHALDASGRLPADVPTAHWIWNEGHPSEIPSWEDRRVVVLGPAPYRRAWNAQRAFGALGSDIRLRRALPRDEAVALARAMGTTARA